jgi:hypothetical protein
VAPPPVAPLELAAAPPVDPALVLEPVLVAVLVAVAPSPVVPLAWLVFASLPPHAAKSVIVTRVLGTRKSADIRMGRRIGILGFVESLVVLGRLGGGSTDQKKLPGDVSLPTRSSPLAAGRAQGRTSCVRGEDLGQSSRPDDFIERSPRGALRPDQVSSESIHFQRAGDPGRGRPDSVRHFARNE